MFCRALTLNLAVSQQCLYSTVTVSVIGFILVTCKTVPCQKYVARRAIKLPVRLDPCSVLLGAAPLMVSRLSGRGRSSSRGSRN